MTLVTNKYSAYVRPADGVYNFSIDELKIELQKDKADQYNAVFIGNLDDEDNSPFRIFCGLAKKQGKLTARFILFCSHLSGEIAAKYKIQDQDKKDWEAEKFDHDSKMWDEAISMIEQKAKKGDRYTIRIELKTEGKFQNVIDIQKASAERKEKTSEAAPF